MEKDDRSTKSPEVSEETITPEEKDKEDQRPSRSQWEELKEIVQKVLLTSRNLGRKARNAYTNIFKADGENSPIDDIKGAFRHIPLSKRGLSYLFFGLIFIVYLLSGIYTVKPGVEAVARIFGK